MECYILCKRKVRGYRKLSKGYLSKGMFCVSEQRLVENHILFNIKVLRNFQMKFLSMMSDIHFFYSDLVGKTVPLKNSKKTVDVALKTFKKNQVC